MEEKLFRMEGEEFLWEGSCVLFVRERGFWGGWAGVWGGLALGGVRGLVGKVGIF
jgi:hypothetical protein